MLKRKERKKTEPLEREWKGNRLCNDVRPIAQHLFFHSFKAKRNFKRKLPQEKRDYTGTAIRKRKENNESSISFRVMSRSGGASRRSQVP